MRTSLSKNSITKSFCLTFKFLKVRQIYFRPPALSGRIPVWDSLSWVCPAYPFCSIPIHRKRLQHRLYFFPSWFSLTHSYYDMLNEITVLVGHSYSRPINTVPLPQTLITFIQSLPSSGPSKNETGHVAGLATTSTNP